MVRTLCWISFVLCFCASWLLGSSGLSHVEFFQLLKYKFFEEPIPDSLMVIHTILFSLRLPRILVVCLVGSALSLAGVLSQGLFRNSLASPTIIGTSSGGMFGAAISFYFSAAWMSWFVVPIAAFCGAAFVTYLIYLLSSQWQYQSTDRLLLAGLAFNAFFAALTSLVVSLLLEDYQKIGGIFHWLFGGFSGRTMNHFYMGFVPIFAGFVLARKVLPRLNVLSLGEEIASTLAVDTIQLRRFTILSIALLVGASISVAGAIPFVGLVIPHITRQLLGPEHRQLALYSTLNGMSLTLMADLLARTLRSPLELEVGLITSILGAPFFLSLLLRKKD